MVCLLVWLSGLLWFTSQIPLSPTTDKTQADAIIVLTGGSNRLEYGLELLADGLGKKLFITGVQDNITVEQLILRDATPEVRAKLSPIPTNLIILGHDAENTIGNAEETKRWLESEQVRSIRLVTSNYHMPRALTEFTKTLINITIIPSPVMPDDFSMADWWKHPDNRNLILSEYHKFLASRARHYLLSLAHHS